MNDIEKYISQFPEGVQDILRKIRALVKAHAPGAEESMAYGMPAYKTNKKPLVYFAAFKNHIGFYATPSGHAEFQEELSRYKQGKGSVQFPLNQAMPYELIEKIVKFRVEENKNHNGEKICQSIKRHDMNKASNHDERMAKMTFATVYPHYVTKVERKGRTKEELLQVIEWLTGYDEKKLQQLMEEKVTFETFFQQASLNPNAHLITGVICGYRVEEIENPLTQQVRYLDKLVDELAKGRKMEKILRVA